MEPGRGKRLRRRLGGRPRSGSVGKPTRRALFTKRRRFREIPEAPEGVSALHDRHVTWLTLRITPRQRWGLLCLAAKRGRSVANLVRPAVIQLLRDANLLTPEQCEPPGPKPGNDPRLQKKLF